MSCLFCEDGCGRLIDTDADPEAFVRLRRDNTIQERELCFVCRDLAWEYDELLPETPSPYCQKSGRGPGQAAWDRSQVYRQFGLGLFRRVAQ